MAVKPRDLAAAQNQVFRLLGVTGGDPAKGGWIAHLESAGFTRDQISAILEAVVAEYNANEGATPDQIAQKVAADAADIGSIDPAQVSANEAAGSTSAQGLAAAFGATLPAIQGFGARSETDISVAGGDERLALLQRALGPDVSNIVIQGRNVFWTDITGDRQSAPLSDLLGEEEAAFDAAEVDRILTDPKLSDTAKITALVKLGLSSTVASEAVRGGGISGGGGGGGRQLTSAELLNQDLQNRLLQRQLDDPNLTSFVDERTGDTVLLDRLGNEVNRLPFGFASIDPERQFALDTIRGVDIPRESIAAENQRALLSAGVRGFESVNQLAPQLGQLALSNAEFTRDVTRQPADFLARAFFSRGGQSPLPVVSQADLINQLRQNILGFNDVLSGFQMPQPNFNNPVASATTNPLLFPQPGPGAPPAGVAPAPSAPAPSLDLSNPWVAQWFKGAGVAPSSSAAPAPTAPVVNPLTATQILQNGINAIRGAEQRSRANVGSFGEPPSVLGFAHGTQFGFVNEPAFRVGEPVRGRPNEELVLNPTGAPVAVIPKRFMGFQDGTFESFQRRTNEPPQDFPLPEPQMERLPGPTQQPGMPSPIPPLPGRNVIYPYPRPPGNGIPSGGYNPNEPIGSPSRGSTRGDVFEVPITPPWPFPRRTPPGPWTPTPGMGRVPFPVPAPVPPQDFPIPQPPREQFPMPPRAPFPQPPPFGFPDGGAPLRPPQQTSPLAGMTQEDVAALFRPFFASQQGDQRYQAGYDINGDGRINLQDIFEFVKQLGGWPGFQGGTRPFEVRGYQSGTPDADALSRFLAGLGKTEAEPGTALGDIAASIAPAPAPSVAPAPAPAATPEPVPAPAIVPGFEQYAHVNQFGPGITYDFGVGNNDQAYIDFLRAVGTPDANIQASLNAAEGAGLNVDAASAALAVPGGGTTVGGFGFNAPQLPVQGAVTQQELLALAQQNSPPAVNAIINGQMPSPLFQGGVGGGAGGEEFALPTLRMLQALTPDELEALRTRLAASNISLDDLIFAVQQRFTPQRTQGARVVGFRDGTMSPDKAREILHDGQVRGQPLTAKQRRFFGARASGKRRRKKK